MRIFHCKRLIIKSLSFIIGRNFVSWKVKPQKELATTSQKFEYVHRKSRCEMLKFQRRSCKLSFLFPPRRQCSPESWLAGYPAGTISHFSKSADDYWYSLFTPSKWPHFSICELYPSLILPSMCKDKSFIMALTSLYPISSPEPSDLMAAHVSLPSVRNTSRFGRKPGCSGLPSGLRFVVCNIRINEPFSLRFFYWLLFTKYQFFMEFFQ